MEQDWGTIFDAAFQAAFSGKSGPVPGAKFRQVVARAAEAQGVPFPPSGMGRFSEFLERFPEKVLIQRTPGRDILVVPATEPGRLSDDRGVSARLRPDIFVALTYFSADAGRHYYVPATDQVVTIPQGSNDQPPLASVPFPPASKDHEFKLRHDFVASDGLSPEAKEALEKALKDGRPLPTFNEAVKRFGLSREWHMFRMADLITRLRAWADEHGIAWSPTWLGDPPVKQEAKAPIQARKLQRDLSTLIQALAGQVTEADLARISVPLDIVLKLLPSGNRG